MADDVAAQMRALADMFAAEHGLDFTLDSLKTLETLVRNDRGKRAAMREHWGAYLGETIVRAGTTLRWGDYDDAVRAAPGVAKLERGADIERVLIAGSTVWFPLAKLDKFLDQGATDSPAAFARVALGMSRPSVETPEAPIDPAKLNAKAVEANRAFFAAPSLEGLRAISANRTHFNTQALAYVLRETGARASALYPLLGGTAEGRGYQRFDSGRAAARELWTLFELGIADRTAEAAELATLIAHADKRVRENAAFVRASVALHAGELASAAEQYARGDAAVRAGTLSAVADFVHDARWHRREIPELGPLAAILTAALGSASERTEALQTVEQMAMWTKTDVTGLLDHVLEVLRGGKPAQIEHALEIFKQHAYAIQRGRAQWDARAAAAMPEIVRHSHALDGSRKVTKVVIAARYALDAYTKLDLDAEQRRAVETALVRVASVR
jgi:hypothetical protein